VKSQEIFVRALACFPRKPAHRKCPDYGIGPWNNTTGIISLPNGVELMAKGFSNLRIML
jgi:hypothetical protein